MSLFSLRKGWGQCLELTGERKEKDSKRGSGAQRQRIMYPVVHQQITCLTSGFCVLIICKMSLMLGKDTEWIRLYPSGGEVLECSSNCQACALGGTNPGSEKSRERKVILFLWGKIRASWKEGLLSWALGNSVLWTGREIWVVGFHEQKNRVFRAF